MNICRGMLLKKVITVYFMNYMKAVMIYTLCAELRRYYW